MNLVSLATGSSSQPADASRTLSGPCSGERGYDGNLSFWSACGLTIWGVATLSGFAVMLAYSSSAGPVAATSPTWPNDSRLRPDVARANLVLLLHPRCPCSRATLNELQEILRMRRGRVTAHVVFLKPRQFSDNWAKSDLWNNAAAIPDVRVSFDEEGVEARRFGATTSGHVALFDELGRLKFHGGITGSRGHQGDNIGSRKVIDLLAGVTTEAAKFPVFGCSLINDCHDEGVDRAVTQ